jgi:hypothetical protein
LRGEPGIGKTAQVEDAIASAAGMRLGLPIRVGVPDEERALMELYPQPRGRQTAVEYVPSQPSTPGLPMPKRDRSRRQGREAPASQR